MLHARRFRVRYALPRDHPDPEAVRHRLDAVVAEALPTALAEALATHDDPRDESIVLIRRLELALVLRAGWRPEAIARAWADEIARALDRAFSTGEGIELLRFEGPADRLARFLAEAVAGTGWDRWYLRPFVHLRPLPISAALRIAICADPDDGLEALVSLPPPTLLRVLGALSRGDARRTLAALTGGGARQPVADDVRTAAAIQERLRDAPADAAGSARLALRLALELARPARRRPSGGTALAARAVAALARQAAAGGRGLAALERTIETGDRVALAALLEEPTEELVAAVARGIESWTPPGAARPPASEEAISAAAGDSRYTRFGALFQLLPHLADLPLAEAAAGLAECGELDAEGALRALVALKALGDARAFTDPVVRDVLGLPASLTARELRVWQREVGRPGAAQVRAAAELAVPSAVLTTVPARGGAVALLVDATSSLWAGARPARSGGEARLAEWARSAAARVVTACPALALPGLAEARQLDPDDDAHAVLARLDALAGDLAALELPPALRGPRSLDLALSVLAQRALRSLARRVPSAGRASLAYLHANVLHVPARLDEEPGRVLVRLGRAPLDVLVRMTGIAHGPARAHWLSDPRPFDLYPEDES